MRGILVLLITLLIISPVISHGDEEHDITPEQKALAIKLVTNCIDSPETCNCNSIPQGEGSEGAVSFCEEKKQLAMQCMRESTEEACEGLDDMYSVPSYLPKFIQDFFKTSVRKLIDNKRDKEIARYGVLIGECISKIEECNCSQFPTVALNFCENKRNLSRSCLTDFDDDACAKLDNEVEDLVPAGVPDIIRKPLSLIIRPLAIAKAQGEKAMAVQKSMKTLEECFDNPEACNCFNIPSKSGAKFCEEHRVLMAPCFSGNITACNELDAMPILPPNMPGFMEKALKPLLERRIREKRNMIMAMYGNESN